MLKKTLAALALGSALFTAGQAMAADYKIDKEGQHAFIEFRIKHLGYSWLYGRFNDFDGSFTFDEKNPSADKVKVTINTNSVDTNHAERDKHLRSGDFLNVSKNPTATFESTEVKANGDSAAFLAELLETGALGSLILAHLSETNNQAALVARAVADLAVGMDVEIARQDRPTRLLPVRARRG